MTQPGSTNDIHNIMNNQMMINEMLSKLVGFPTIVCLVGSTKFIKHFQSAAAYETLSGKIVLTVGVDFKDPRFVKSMSDFLVKKSKKQLDELHLRKIDLASEVLVIDIDQYVGESTMREIEYARQNGKHIRSYSEEYLNRDGFFYTSYHS